MCVQAGTSNFIMCVCKRKTIIITKIYSTTDQLSTPVDWISRYWQTFLSWFPEEAIIADDIWI